MRVILSRKGVDGTSGGIPNLIVNNEMVMLPIPYQGDKSTYNDLKTTGGENLFDLMQKHIPGLDKKSITRNTRCHADPNIVNYFNEQDFLGSIGQVGIPQSHLEKNHIKINDLFIFFGWFKNAESKTFKHDIGKHIIFGYLQIGEIIKNPENMSNTQRAEYENKYPWLKSQPHWTEQEKYKDYKYQNNTLYIAREKCSFDSTLKGFGVFNYNQTLELTLQYAQQKSQWELPAELKGLKITYHKNADKGDYFKSTGRGQEFVIENSPRAENWAINLIKKYAKR